MLLLGEARLDLARHRVRRRHAGVVECRRCGIGHGRIGVMRMVVVVLSTGVEVGLVVAGVVEDVMGAGDECHGRRPFVRANAGPTSRPAAEGGLQG